MEETQNSNASTTEISNDTNNFPTAQQQQFPPTIHGLHNTRDTNYNSSNTLLPKNKKSSSRESPPPSSDNSGLLSSFTPMSTQHPKATPVSFVGSSPSRSSSASDKGENEDEDEDDEVEEEPKDKEEDKSKIGRRKINIEFIKNKSRRHVTFSKRKAGLIKKAYELSTLTGTQVLLLVASETGNVYTFATPKLQPLISKPEGKSLIQSCLNPPLDDMAMRSAEMVANANAQITQAQIQNQMLQASLHMNQMQPNRLPHQMNHPEYMDKKEHYMKSISPPLDMNGYPYHHLGMGMSQPGGIPLSHQMAQVQTILGRYGPPSPAYNYQMMNQMPLTGQIPQMGPSLHNQQHNQHQMANSSHISLNQLNMPSNVPYAPNSTPKSESNE